MHGLLDNVRQFLGAEDQAPALEQLADEALAGLALWIEDRDLQGGATLHIGIKLVRARGH